MAELDELIATVAKVKGWLVVLLVSTGLASALLLFTMAETKAKVRTLEAQIAFLKGTPDILRAHSLDLFDDKGQPSIHLGGAKNEIILYRDTGIPSVLVRGRETGSIGVTIWAESGMSANLHAGYLNLQGLIPANDVGSVAPSITVAAMDLASVEVTDALGFKTIMGENELINKATGESTHTSAAALFMFAKDGKALWRAPQ